MTTTTEPRSIPFRWGCILPPAEAERHAKEIAQEALRTCDRGDLMAGAFGSLANQYRWAWDYIQELRAENERLKNPAPRCPECGTALDEVDPECGYSVLRGDEMAVRQIPEPYYCPWCFVGVEASEL